MENELTDLDGLGSEYVGTWVAVNCFHYWLADIQDDRKPDSSLPGDLALVNNLAKGLDL